MADRWRLETFLDSLIVELDKAQDTLSVKGLTRPLTYTVKDVALDLAVLPEYHQGAVWFRSAQAGDEKRSSKISLQLGSITRDQIKKHTKDPITGDDISIDRLEGLNDDVRRKLKSRGVTSARDLETWRKRDISIEDVLVPEESDPNAGSEVRGRETEPEVQAPADRRSEAPAPRPRSSRRSGVSYENLAQLVNQARRKRLRPSVRSATLDTGKGRPQLALLGENLSLTQEFDGFPTAILGDRKVEILRAVPGELRLALDSEQIEDLPGQLHVALDPFAVITMELEA